MITFLDRNSEGPLMITFLDRNSERWTDNKLLFKFSILTLYQIESENPPRNWNSNQPKNLSKF